MNWKESLILELNANDEEWDDIVSCTLSDKELNEEFEDNYGYPMGESFTAWTKNRVYFPFYGKGYEFVVSVSRNPDGKPTDHMGVW